MLDFTNNVGDATPTPETLIRRRSEVVAGIATKALLDDNHPMCGVIDLDTIDDLMFALTSRFHADFVS